MSSIWNNTMNTESSSEMYANSFQRSQEVASEGTSGSEPVITQQDQVASVSYRPADVSKPNQTQGEISVALPFFTPEHTMGFQDWATNGWDTEGRTKTNPGMEDYHHEPAYPDPFTFASKEPSYKQEPHVSTRKGKS